MAKKKSTLITKELNNNLMSSVFAKKIVHPNPNELTKDNKFSESQIELETNDLSVTPHSSDTMPQPHNVAPQSGTEAPQLHNVAPQSGTEALKPQEVPFHLDIEKLKTIINEISQIEVNKDGLNIRISNQESKDIEEFIYDKLRKSGLKGYDVSASKLMRYAFRYISRVHEKEFIKALELALKSESNLSI